MKKKTTLTIRLGDFEKIDTEIELDTDNLEEAKKDVLKLWDAFHNLVQFRPNKNSPDQEAIQYQKEDKNAVAGQAEAIINAFGEVRGLVKPLPMRFRADSMKVQPASQKQIDFINTLAKERNRVVDTSKMDSWQASQTIKELKEISVVETDETKQKAILDDDLDEQHLADLEAANK